MDYDVSISIGTTANLGDLTKANKAVQDWPRLPSRCRIVYFPEAWAVPLLRLIPGQPPEAA